MDYHNYFKEPVSTGLKMHSENFMVYPFCEKYADWAFNTQEFVLFKLDKQKDKEFLARLRLIMLPIKEHMNECSTCKISQL